jgi:uncharacterized protein YggL (DUF469 family)
MSAPCPTFGFLVVMELADGSETGPSHELRNAWIRFLETLGLYCTDGSGGDAEPGLRYVVASEASQATESDRLAAQAWLAARRELLSWRVGKLEDFS